MANEIIACPALAFSELIIELSHQKSQYTCPPFRVSLCILQGSDVSIRPCSPRMWHFEFRYASLIKYLTKLIADWSLPAPDREHLMRMEFMLQNLAFPFRDDASMQLGLLHVNDVYAKTTSQQSDDGTPILRVQYSAALAQESNSEISPKGKEDGNEQEVEDSGEVQLSPEDDVVQTTAVVLKELGQAADEHLGAEMLEVRNAEPVEGMDVDDPTPPAPIAGSSPSSLALKPSTISLLREHIVERLREGLRDSPTDRLAVLQLFQLNDCGGEDQSMSNTTDDRELPDGKLIPGTLKPLSFEELTFVFRFLVRICHDPHLLGQSLGSHFKREPSHAVLAVCAVVRLVSMMREHVKGNPEWHFGSQSVHEPHVRCLGPSSLGIQCICESDHPLRHLDQHVLPGILMLISHRRNMDHWAAHASAYLSPKIESPGHPLHGSTFVTILKLVDADSGLLEPVPPQRHFPSYVDITDHILEEQNQATAPSIHNMRQVFATVKANKAVMLLPEKRRFGMSIEPLLQSSQEGLFRPRLRPQYTIKTPTLYPDSSVLVLVKSKHIRAMVENKNVHNLCSSFSYSVSTTEALDHASVALPLAPSLMVYDQVDQMDTQCPLFQYFAQIRNRAAVRSGPSTVQRPRFLFVMPTPTPDSFDDIALTYQLCQADRARRESFFDNILWPACRWFDRKPALLQRVHPEGYQKGSLESGADGSVLDWDTFYSNLLRSMEEFMICI